MYTLESRAIGITCLIALLVGSRIIPNGENYITRVDIFRAWASLAVAFGINLLGTIVSLSDWARGVDPFPGVADIFYCAFYPAMMVATLLLIRAASIRIPWMQLALDATIFVVGFGTFFWF